MIVSAFLVAVLPAVDVYAFGALEQSLSRQAGGHGIGFVGARFSEVAAGTVDLWLNTDTFHARLGNVQLAPSLVGGIQADGEAVFAGVLPTYYQRGALLNQRAIRASYAAVTGDLTLYVGRQSLRQAVSARRWFFGRARETAANVVLPPDTWAVEERLAYTYWALAEDLSLYDWHRTTQRLRGVAFGLELGLDGRSETSIWGAPDDPRNQPHHVITHGRQWLLFGAQLTDRARIQAREAAGVGNNDDDLTRVRVGGSNPYAIPIVGTPWPAFLVSTYAALEVTLPVKIAYDIEVGPIADIAALVDRDRQGSRRVGAVAGLGGFADLRLGPWQVDVRAGWSPPTGWSTTTPQASLFVAGGRVW